MEAISGVYVSVCWFVRLSVFPHDISKTDAAGITKLDIDVVHHESWKHINLGSKGQRSRSCSTKTRLCRPSEGTQC